MLCLKLTDLPPSLDSGFLDVGFQHPHGLVLLWTSEVNAVLKAHWFTPFIGFWFPWCWVSASAWPCASVDILWRCVQTHASLQSRRVKIFTYAYSYNQMIMSICSSLYEHFPTVIVSLHEQVHSPWPSDWTIYTQHSFPMGLSSASKRTLGGVHHSSDIIAVTTAQLPLQLAALKGVSLTWLQARRFHRSSSILSPCTYSHHAFNASKN